MMMLMMMMIQAVERGVEWIDLAEDRDKWRTLVNAVMNYRVPQDTGNILTGCGIGSVLRRILLLGVIISSLSKLAAADVFN